MLDKLKILLQYLVPQHALTRLVGKAAECRTIWFKNIFINWFIRRYKVDMQEAAQPDPTAYACFNDFFTRALKAGARPIAKQAGAIISPADGFISQLGQINEQKIFQAKGHTFDLVQLLGGDAQRAAPFQNGQFATIYLSPKDYHRVHIPFAGHLQEMVYIPGKLFSVNPLTTQNVNNLFARNERVACIFNTDIGKMALVFVGAMIVGSVETTWAGIVAPHQPRQIKTFNYQEPINLAMGEEAGRFRLGSTTIILFESNKMLWDKNLVPDQSVKMGQVIGSLL